MQKSENQVNEKPATCLGGCAAATLRKRRRAKLQN
jgi:hypothetical protein